MYNIADINNIDDLYKCIEKIIRCAKKLGKIVVATGDCHYCDPEEKQYRTIYKIS